LDAFSVDDDTDSLGAFSVRADALRVLLDGAQVAGTTALVDGRTGLTFTPSAPLAMETTYTIEVDNVTDRVGNVVDAFSSSFSTASSTALDTTGPRFLSITPLNGVSNVAVDTMVIWTFDEPIDPLSSVDGQNNFRVSLLGTNSPVAGSYVASGNTVIFTPLAPFSAGQEVIAASGQVIRDLVGNTGVNGGATRFTINEDLANVDTTRSQDCRCRCPRDRS